MPDLTHPECGIPPSLTPEMEAELRAFAEQDEKEQGAHGGLQLYVWRLSVHRKATVAFALARTPNEARRLILANLPIYLDRWRGRIEEALQAEPVVYGEPHGLCL